MKFLGRLLFLNITHLLGVPRFPNEVTFDMQDISGLRFGDVELVGWFRNETPGLSTIIHYWLVVEPTHLKNISQIG